MKYTLLFIMIGMMVIPALSAADEQKADQVLLIAQADTSKHEPSENSPNTSGSWISDGKAYGKWWTQRAKTIDPMPPELLYHLEASYSFKKLTGSEDQKYHKGKLNLALRKNIVTSFTNYKLKDKESSYGGYSPNITEKQSLDEFIFVEAFDKMDFAVYLQWKTDNKKYLEDGMSYAGGVYYTFFSSPKYKLTAGLLYGYSNLSYMNDDLREKYGVEFDDYSSDMVMVDQAFRWFMTDKLTLTESASIKQYIKDTDYKHWLVNLDLNYQITKNISVFTSYEIEYDSNELDDKLMGIEEEDTTLDCGIRLTF